MFLFLIAFSEYLNFMFHNQFFQLLFDCELNLMFFFLLFSYYGFSAGKLNEFEVFVTKEAFFSKRAEDSDICKSFITDLGGAFVLALLMSGVMPFVILCNKKKYLLLKKFMTTK